MSNTKKFKSKTTVRVGENLYVGELNGLKDWVKKLDEKYRKEKINYEPMNKEKN
tara:strand:+ start:49 stop:210 length:162 start_codon:yes stop_codon:yes gene_type:complete